MRIFLITICFLFASVVNADINMELQKKLLDMESVDQNSRNEILTYGIKTIPKELINKINDIDLKNTEKLKKILSEHGWLNKQLVGKQGMSAAFLVIQHSPDLNFQDSMLAKLNQSYKNNNDISGHELALLTDKVKIAQGKKQIYGTQVNLENNQIIFQPIKDEVKVDKLRAEMKMPPLAQYKKSMEELFGVKSGN